MSRQLKPWWTLALQSPLILLYVVLLYPLRMLTNWLEENVL